jgi:hypothetical protein
MPDGISGGLGFFRLQWTECIDLGSDRELGAPRGEAPARDCMSIRMQALNRMATKDGRAHVRS